ncbi:RNA polymerase sigma factor [Arenibacter certesii]|uniref:DNA-directed RNA polymerase sigma-70 factor n=1 Tax=Arenibacter certesii TaxID=228955 RepID=A0A918J284_9FLAO|nr:RNA polymerase sigma-70 factor [Arenibacter certesii]GGW41862.1 DNA-directed RNA polymerase sigma-70 factor [Arenibacter certesii]
MYVDEAKSERILILDLNKGNEQAFRKLFDTYGNDIYTYSLSLLKSPDSAKEIVQDVFLKVWLKRKTINPDQSFKSWVFTIARNLSFNVLQKSVNDKKLKQEIFYQRQEAYSHIDRGFQEAEFELLRLKAIDTLPPKRRLIFKMSREEDKSYQEISVVLKISVSTVKNQMSKSLGTVRTFLQANGDLTLLIAYVFLII